MLRIVANFSTNQNAFVIAVVFAKTISDPIRKMKEICRRKTIWVKLCDIFCSCTEFVILHQPLVIAYAQSWLMI